MIIDESTLRKLNQVSLIASKVRAGAIKGERRSTKRGTSIEFADYRDYTPGDDLRRLDWNVYARLERPFTKLLEEEEDLAVHILVDGSKSMDWGEGDQNKFLYALRLTAALGTIALSAGDNLSIAILYAGTRQPQFGPSRGQGQMMRLFSFLDMHKAEGITNLNVSLHGYTLTARRAGLVFLISDLFSPGDNQSGLWQLLARGHEVVLLHVLNPDELDPPLAGDLRLIDVETGQAQEVSLDGGIRTLYRRKVESWLDEIQVECHKRGVRYIPINTAQPWDDIVLLGLRKAGVLK